MLLYNIPIILIRLWSLGITRVVYNSYLAIMDYKYELINVAHSNIDIEVGV